MLVADFVDSVDNAFATFWDWLPRVLGAIGVLIVAWIVAKVVAGLVRRILVRIGLDRLVEKRGPEFLKRATTSLSGALGTLVFWLILLAGFGIAADVLGVPSVEAAVSRIWHYIPNVIAAVAILIAAGLLAPWVAKLISSSLSGRAIGQILGTAAMVLILSVGVFMALDQLEIANTIVTITYAALMGSVALGLALAFGLGGREAAAGAIRGAYEHGSRLSQLSDSRPTPPSTPPTVTDPDPPTS